MFRRLVCLAIVIAALRYRHLAAATHPPLQELADMRLTPKPSSLHLQQLECRPVLRISPFLPLFFPSMRRPDQ